MTSLLSRNCRSCLWDRLPLGLRDPLVPLDLRRLLILFLWLLELLGFLQELLVSSSLPFVLVWRLGWRVWLLNLIWFTNWIVFFTLHLGQNSFGASIVPQVLVVVDDLQQSFLKGTIYLSLFRLKSVDLLPDERVCSHDVGKTRAIDPELLQLLHISKWTCSSWVPTNVQVLECHEQGMDPIQKSVNIRDLIRFICLGNSKEIFCCSSEPCLLWNRVRSGSDLRCWVVGDHPMHQEVPAELLDEFLVRLLRIQKNHVRVIANESASELSVIFLCHLWDLRRIFFHLGPSSRDLRLQCVASMPHCCDLHQW